MPSGERASFMELSLSDLAVKWRYGSGHEHGPGPTVANIALPWKTLYKQLWDSSGFTWRILGNALCFTREPLVGRVGGGDMIVGLSPKDLQSSSG